MPVVDRSDPRTWPEPMDEGWGALNLLGILALVVGGAVFIPLACPATTTNGATRSARLQWEERRSAIDEAVAQQDDPSVDVPAQQDWQP